MMIKKEELEDWGDRLAFVRRQHEEYQREKEEVKREKKKEEVKKEKKEEEKEEMQKRTAKVVGSEARGDSTSRRNTSINSDCHQGSG